MVITGSISERADALELAKSDELDVLLYTKSALANMEDGKLGTSGTGSERAMEPGNFFRFRARSTNHLLQSATHALKAGRSEKVILACLLHDIANAIFIKSDHGYWGAQLIEP